MALSLYIEEKGEALFTLTKERNLEGVVAKKKDSKYTYGKRTKEWIKIKNIKNNYIICGYIHKENNVTSLVLGQFGPRGEMVYCGHVPLGISGRDFSMIENQKEVSDPPFTPPKGNETAIWIEPVLVGTMKYMEKIESGYLRHAVFKGLRKDKTVKSVL